MEEPGAPQILADQLTLFQLGRTDYARQITTRPSRFSHLPPSLLLIFSQNVYILTLWVLLLLVLSINKWEILMSYLPKCRWTKKVSEWKWVRVFLSDDGLNEMFCNLWERQHFSNVFSKFLNPNYFFQFDF